jgi:hypothetical protein
VDVGSDDAISENPDGSMPPQSSGEPSQPSAPADPNGQPANGQPSAAPAGYGPPPYGFPPYGQPGYGQPAYGQPAYGQPVYGAPVYGQPYPPPGYAAPQGKRKRFGWLALTVAFILGGFLSFVVVVGMAALIFANDDGPGTDQHGVIKEGAVVPKVGDCLRPPPSRAIVTSDAQVVDCAKSHGSEVAAIVEIPAGSQRPSRDNLGYYADDACLIAFEGYVGSDWDDSDLDYQPVVPSASAWDQGDRTLWCLVDTGGEAGTVRNSHD